MLTWSIRCSIQDAAKNSSHDAKQIGESPLTRIQIRDGQKISILKRNYTAFYDRYFFCVISIFDDISALPATDTAFF